MFGSFFSKKNVEFCSRLKGLKGRQFAPSNDKIVKFFKFQKWTSNLVDLASSNWVNFYFEKLSIIKKSIFLSIAPCFFYFFLVK